MPIQLKRKITSLWQSENPILKSGEVGVEQTPENYFKAKIGDEVTAWNTLPYPFVHTKGNNSLSGIQDLNSGVIQNTIIKNYSESLQNVSISSAILSLNLSSGNVFRTTLDSNITGIVINSVYPSGNTHSFTMIMDYASSGVSVIWPSNILWNGGSGSLPIIGSGIGRSAILSFMTNNGGNTYYGFVGGNNFGV